MDVKSIDGGLTELRHVVTRELDLSLGRLRQFPEGAVKAMMESFSKKGWLSPLVAGSHDGMGKLAPEGVSLPFAPL